MDLSGKRYVFFVDETMDPDGKGFIPAIVIDGEPGYHLMGDPDSDGVSSPLPWRWGSTIEAARAECDRANVRLGILPEQAQRIVARSLLAAQEG